MNWKRLGFTLLIIGILGEVVGSWAWNTILTGPEPPYWSQTKYYADFASLANSAARLLWFGVAVLIASVGRKVDRS